MELIQQAGDQSIPIIKMRTLPSPKYTPEIKRLIAALKWQLIEFPIRTWNGPRNVQHMRWQIQEEYRKENNKSWQNLIDKVKLTKDTTDFWTQINRMRGISKERKTIQLKDEHNEILDTDLEKETAFRNRLESIFSITEEDNEDFDEENELQVQRYLHNRIRDITPDKDLLN